MISAYTLASDLNRALHDNPQKVNKIVYDHLPHSVLGEVNGMLKVRGDKWIVLAVFADRENKRIKRFDIFNEEQDTHIVMDPNCKSWFDWH